MHDPRVPAMDGSTTHRTRRGLARALRRLSAGDVLVATYFGVLALAALAVRGPESAAVQRLIGYDLMALIGALILLRSGILPADGWLQAVGDRLLGPAAVVLSYFQLRTILPAVAPSTRDAALLAIDLRLLGFEPALALDRWVSPPVTEWFSFFYFGYYFLLAAFLGVMAFGARDPHRQAGFLVGLLFTFVTAHVLYLLVPALGPHVALRDTFTRELSGGTWWSVVESSVRDLGAGQDVFPSLHTAAPAFLTLFLWRHRRTPAYGRALVPVALLATQIVAAALFLRWHYLVDVLAGLLVALAADAVGARLGPWEVERRARTGLPPMIAPLPRHRGPLPAGSRS